MWRDADRRALGGNEDMSKRKDEEERGRISEEGAASVSVWVLVNNCKYYQKNSHSLISFALSH